MPLHAYISTKHFCSVHLHGPRRPIRIYHFPHSTHSRDLSSPPMQNPRRSVKSEISRIWLIYAQPSVKRRLSQELQEQGIGRRQDRLILTFPAHFPTRVSELTTNQHQEAPLQQAIRIDRQRGNISMTGPRQARRLNSVPAYQGLQMEFRSWSR